MATNENQSIQKNFPVLQMTCAGCAAGVENKLKSLKGVKNAAVNFATATALVDFQPGEIDAEGIQKAVQSIGYDLVLEEENQQDLLDEIHEKNYRQLKNKTVWALILSLPVVIVGMFLMNIPYADLIMWAFATPVVLWLGRDFFITAWKQTRHRTANMDTLVALSTGTAYVFSLFNMLFPEFWQSKGLEGHVYFEAAAVIIAFILLGRLLEE
ncbi:MAG: cation transporter, partial [Petrimonas sp.]|nr:cation transporter [Petrimonas sp.]